MRLWKLVVWSSFIWVSYGNPSSVYCVMLYFWLGCRGNLRFITLGSERVKTCLPFSHPSLESGTWQHCKIFKINVRTSLFHQCWIRMNSTLNQPGNGVSVLDFPTALGKQNYSCLKLIYNQSCILLRQYKRTSIAAPRRLGGREKALLSHMRTPARVPASVIVATIIDSLLDIFAERW